MYRLDAFDGGAQLKKSATEVNLKRTYAGGRGDAKSPVVEMTAEIRTDGTSYKVYKERLGINETSTPSPSPTSSP